jgi:hypothetical protein
MSNNGADHAHNHSFTAQELICVVRVQAIARKWIARHHYLMVRKFVIKVQAIVRAWLVAKRLLAAGMQIDLYTFDRTK